MSDSEKYLDGLANNTGAHNSVGGYAGPFTRRPAPPGTFNAPIVPARPRPPAPKPPASKGPRRK
jgi:hypothetical protein